MSPSNRILNLFLLLSVVFASAIPAQAQRYDDGTRLGIVLSRRSYTYEAKRFLYFERRLRTKFDMFKKNRIAALTDVGYQFTTVSHGVAVHDDGSYVTDRQFLDLAAVKIHGEMDATNLAAMPAGKVLKVAAAVGTAVLFEGAPLVLAATGSGASSELTDALLGKIQFPREELSAVSTEMIFDVAYETVSEIEGKTDFGAIIQGELERSTDIEDLSKLEDVPEVRQHEIEMRVGQVDTEHDIKNEALVEEVNRLKALMAERSRMDQKRDEAAKQEDTKAEELKSLAEAEEARKKEIEDELKGIQTGFYAMSVIGKVLGHSEADTKKIEQLSKLAGSIHTIMTTEFSAEPADVTLSYFMIVDIVWQLMQDDDGPSADAQLMEAIKGLSEQIDDLRVELLDRFQRLDYTLARGFGQQASLLNAIIANQQGQSQQLLILSDQIKNARADVVSVVSAFENRENDLRLASCLRLQIPEGATREMMHDYRREIQDCLQNGTSMAVSWSKDAGSVESSFYALGDTTTRPRFIDLNAYVPLLFQVRDVNLVRVGNPEMWSIGAGLFIETLVNNPLGVDWISSSDFDRVIDEGRNLQSAYRAAFAKYDPVTRAYSTDLMWLQGLVDRYQDSVTEYLDALQVAAQALEVPWDGPEQRLPEETEFNYDTGMSVEARQAWKNGMDWSLVDEGIVYPVWGVEGGFPLWHNGPDLKARRNSDWGRGNLSAGQFSLAGYDMRMCDNVREEDFIHTGQRVHGEFHNGFPIHIWRGEREFLRTQGLRLDESILSLIPRPALWLERLDPSYNIEACVFSLVTQTDHSKKDEWYSRRYSNVHMGVRVTLKHINEDDVIETKPLLYLTSMSHQEGECYWPADGDDISTVTPLKKLWNGYQACARKFEPAAGNLDRFFAPVGMNTEQLNTLAYIREKVQEAKARKLGSSDSALSIGLAAATREAAERDRRILEISAILGADLVPEAAVFFKKLRQPITLITPDGARKVIFEDGISPQTLKNNLNRQVLALKKLAGTASGRKLKEPVATPFDADIATLETLKATQSSASK